MFVPGKPFQSSLMFAGKAGAYLKGAPLYGRLLASPTNIRLGWERLAKDKHSDILQISANYGHKKFYYSWPLGRHETALVDTTYL